MQFAEGVLEGSKELPALQAGLYPLSCLPREEVGLLIHQSSSLGIRFASILYYFPSI